MHFYYADKNKELDGTVFKPRIPPNRLESEDGTIPRICVSTSIAGCLTAMPKWVVQDIVTIYCIESDNYVQPSVNLLIDVPITGEMWILEPVQLKRFCHVSIQGHSITSIGEMMVNNYTFTSYNLPRPKGKEDDDGL